MKRIKRLFVIAIACLGVSAIAPSFASACAATAGPVTYESASLDYDSWGGFSCSTATNSIYQLRLYTQTDEGGSYHISFGPVIEYYPRVSRPAGFVSQHFHFQTYCSSMETYVHPTSPHVRTKAVLENLDTGSIDVDYGLARTTVQGCNGS